MEPVRTCVGCRQRASRSHLLRIINKSTPESPVLIFDKAATMPGRGAWLHQSPECLKLAIERRAFGRTLRLKGSPDVQSLNF